MGLNSIRAFLLIFMQLKIMTLNVQGFRRPGKQAEVINFSIAAGCDLLLLQETKFRSRHDVLTFERRHDVKGFFSFGTRCSEGVGIVILRPSSLQHCAATFDYRGRVACLDISCAGEKIRFNVYGPARRGFLHLFFQNLDVFMLDTAAIVLVGDFNCVLDATRDTRGPGSIRPAWYARELRRLIHQYDLRDVWNHMYPNTFSYTWRRGASLSRLDRAYVAPHLVNYVSQCAVMHFPQTAGYISDHFPFSFTLSFPWHQAPSLDTWRLDVSLLRNELAVSSVSAAITASLPSSQALL